MIKIIESENTAGRATVEVSSDYMSVKPNKSGWYVYYGWITDDGGTYYKNVKSDHKLSKQEIKQMLLSVANK